MSAWLLLWASLASAADVSGRVVAAKGGAPVAGANVTISSISMFTSTDSDGRYTLREVPPGVYVLEVSADGYATRKIADVHVTADGAHVNPRLTVATGQTAEGGSVLVTAARLARVRDTTVSVQTVTKEEVKQVSGALEDPLKTLLFLPGVGSATDFAGALFVRGGNPQENTFLWDGVVMADPYHLVIAGGGLNSIFNPDMMSDLTLYKGAFPSQYGDALSAVMDLRSRRAEGDKPHGVVSLGIIDSKASLDLPDVLPGVNVVLGARRSYYDLAYRLFSGNSNLVLPTFWDTQARVEADLGKAGTLQFDFMYFNDDFGFSGTSRSGQSRSFQYTAPGYMGGLVWKKVLQENLLNTMTVSLETSSVSALFAANNPLNLNYSEKNWQISDKLLWNPVGNHEITIGIDVFPRKLDFAFHLPVVAMGGEGISANTFSYSASLPWYYKADGYLEDKFLVTPWLTITSGVRSDYHRALRQEFLDPRVATTLALWPGTLLKAAFGVVHQSPDNNFAPGISIADLHYQEAAHTVLGMEHQFSDTTHLTAEGYYRDLRNLMAPPFSGHTGSAFGLQSYINGRGYAYGGEIVLRQDLWKGLSGWVSYGYGVAQQQDDPTLAWYHTDTDLTHSASLVGTYDYRTWIFTIRERYQTGAPYTPVEKANYNAVLGNWVPSYRSTNSLRYSSYFRLDLRVEKEWGYGWGKLKAYLEVENVTNRLNVWQIFYNADYTQQIPIGQIPRLPTFGIEADF